jgi:hypothetical protein
MRLLAGKVFGHLDLKEMGYEEEVIKLALETFGAGNFVAQPMRTPRDWCHGMDYGRRSTD